MNLNAVDDSSNKGGVGGKLVAFGTSVARPSASSAVS
jgi:hypothetical protein